MELKEEIKRYIAQDAVHHDIMRLLIPEYDASGQSFELFPLRDLLISFEISDEQDLYILETLPKMWELEHQAVLLQGSEVDFFIINLTEPYEQRTMPLDNMLASSVAYLAQCAQMLITKRQKEAQETGLDTHLIELGKTPISHDEAWSGFSNADYQAGVRLRGAIILTVYWNNGPITGPMSMIEMINVNEFTEKFAPKVEVHMLAPSTATKDQFDSCRSSLGTVLLALKEAKDGHDLGAMLSSDPRFEGLDLEAAKILHMLAQRGLTRQPSEVANEADSAFSQM